jgi:hypothetical protein
VAKRDPHIVLGVPRGSTQAEIKAAWRRLAREHHPDLASSDPDAVISATRRMAEINDAYEALRRPAGSVAESGDGARRRGGPPPDRPTRPVTGRVDTTTTFRPRNATTGPAVRHARVATPRGGRTTSPPLRASEPSGPLQRARVRGFRRPALPPLDVARAHVMAFGKFHGHTLGEIAAFEPSYIDWLARTISRDPELVAAARAVQLDLDARGIVRPVRPDRPVSSATR